MLNFKFTLNIKASKQPKRKPCNEKAANAIDWSQNDNKNLKLVFVLVNY